MKTESVSELEFQTITNGDRLLPSQPWLSKLYSGENFHADLEGLLLSMLPHKSVTNKLNITLKDGITYASLGSDINTLSFLQLLVRIGGYRRVLELGTYIGVSTLFLAEAVGINGEVVTVEKGDEFSSIALGNFASNITNIKRGKIKQVNGDAVQVMKDYAERGESFDVIFIDAAKESYTHLLRMAVACCAPKGMILVDDVFFQGDTLNEKATTEKGGGVRRMLDYAEILNGWQKVILPIGNGLLIMINY